MNYAKMSEQELQKEYSAVKASYATAKEQKLCLDMSRGKPGEEQLEISLHMLDIVNSASSCKTQSGADCRNYGLLQGLPSCRELFAKMLQVEPSMVMVGGNSSLNLMFDAVSTLMTKPVKQGLKPWGEVANRKFLCPVPGYDRHFSITEYFGFEMICIPMTETGPDMDLIEKLIAEDEDIKGIWCVPKYSNPQGITYSDETVRRFAALKPAAEDFRIFWDDAYCVHDVNDDGDKLLSLYDECKKTGSEDIAIYFASTSKVTFPGSGVAAMAASPLNMEFFVKRFTNQTIGYDKINMLRHMLFFAATAEESDECKNAADKIYCGLIRHMGKHKEILKPRFNVVINALQEQLADTGTIEWRNPNGGYFVSVNVTPGTAKRVVALCKEAGLVLTGAGATFPLGADPADSNIRIAPTYPSVEELKSAMEVFCVCVKLAALEKLCS